MTENARYIIKPPGAYTAFREFAEKHGLRIIDKTEREPGSPIALQEVFGNAEHTVGVHYIEDGLVDLPYLKVAGPRAEHYSRLIEQHLPVYTEHELLDSWDTAATTEEQIDAILRLGLAASAEESPPYSTRMRQALGHPDPEVRSAGLTAFSYHPWEELRSLVELIANKDTDEDARTQARLVLDAWIKQHQPA